jgi:hypothetical protein
MLRLAAPRSGANDARGYAGTPAAALRIPAVAGLPAWRAASMGAAQRARSLLLPRGRIAGGWPATAVWPQIANYWHLTTSLDVGDLLIHSVPRCLVVANYAFRRSRIRAVAHRQEHVANTKDIRSACGRSGKQVQRPVLV